ncbi:hypothetical protein Tco_0618088 [Tanacetum coccineum]
MREYVLAKPNHVIAHGSSRNSQEEYYGSNDMAHNHYLEEVRKKTQERNRNSKPSAMPSVRLQNTANGSTPNPKGTNQTSRSLPTSKSSCVAITVMPIANHSRNSSSFSDSKHFFCSTCHKCVFNANHDACITKLLNEVNSRKISSGDRFSPKKTFVVYEKTSPRSCLRWKPMSRIFKTAGHRWIPTGKMFTDCTTKVDIEPSNGSNEDITNPYECDQTLNVSVGTLNLSTVQASLFNDRWHLQITLQAPFLKEKEGLVQNSVSPTPYVPPSKKDYEILFQLLFYEYFNPPPHVVSPDPVAVAAPRAVDPADSPSSTTIDQDVPLLVLHQQIKKFNLKSLIKKSLGMTYKRSKCENKGIVPTEMELELEQTQQGSSHEVSVSTEGVEE